MTKLHTIAPAPDLRRYISAYLFLSSDGKEDLSYAPPQLSSGWAFLWGESTIKQGKASIDLPPNYVVPITPDPFRAVSHCPSRVVAIKFYPGRFSEFWGWPQDLFTDDTVALPDTDIGRQAVLLHEALDDAQTRSQQAHTLDQFFLHHLPQQPQSCPLVQSLLRHIYTHPQIQSLKAMPHRTQISLRHLRRLFKRQTGLNARTFVRISRFYRAYFLMQSGHYASLTDLALEAGYFDQAHFNHDFRKFTGRSPRAFLQQQHPEAVLAWEGVVDG